MLKMALRGYVEMTVSRSMTTWRPLSSRMRPWTTSPLTRRTESLPSAARGPDDRPGAEQADKRIENTKALTVRRRIPLSSLVHPSRGGCSKIERADQEFEALHPGSGG